MKRIPPFRWQIVALRWLVACCVTVLLTVLLVTLHANATSSAILYLVLVVWFATQAGTALSICISLFCAALFDYFFLEPLYQFSISGVQDWLAMIAFVVSCIVVARVAEHARRQTRQAEQRRADVERLYSLSQEMMLNEDAAGLVHDTPRLIERIFDLDAVVLYVRDLNKAENPTAVQNSPHYASGDQLYSSVPGHDSDRLRIALRELPNTLEPPPILPEDFVPIQLVFGMKTVGTLAWKPATLSREVAASVAAQVAIALTRSIAIEASTQLEAARASDRLRTALIDSLTHELRTPLTAIRAAATTLVDGYGLDNESRTELASIVDEESARLDHLIGQAIEMAQIDADGIRPHLVPVHIGTILQQAVEQSRPQLTHHRVEISVEDSEIPVWCDPHLIGRVLRHLLENAGTYTPHGTQITISCRILDQSVEFEVADKGPGILAQDLPFIFEKFYRGKRGTNSSKGSGMGLAISRAIITALHGSISVESAQGKGTTFCIRIPIVEKAPHPLVPNAIADPL